jgi:diguanylate cyclase (GGDEF)-like protein
MLDLDHFKRINDTYGHLAGDDVLKAFAELVRNCLRKEDLLARYGGEEFVVLLPGAAPAAAAILAERIREEVAARPFDANGRLVRVTVSQGVASEGGDTLPSLEAMLGRADEALYSAKNQGRNRVVAVTMPQAAGPAKPALQAVPTRS